MATVIKPYTFSANTPAYAEHINANFDMPYGEINGALDLANLRDEQFIVSLNFHCEGAVPASTADAREIIFKWTQANVTLNEMGIAYTATAGGAAAEGYVRVELFEWNGAAWVSMNASIAAITLFGAVYDTAFSTTPDYLVTNTTYKLKIQSVQDGDGDESNATEVDVWIEGRASLAEGNP